MFQHDFNGGAPASGREGRGGLRRRLLAATAGSAAGLCLPGAAAAAEPGFPSRPVRMVVPFSPGGATDVLARLVASGMADVLPQPVVVENRVGAAGAIGAAAVAKAPADGYSILFGGVGTNIVLTYTQSSLPYDPFTDFAPVGNACNVDFVLTVAADSPDRTLGDLIARAKRQPGSVSYMSGGTLGSLHVALEYLARRAGVKLMHVPYKGESHALPDLLAGRLDVAVMTLSLVGPQAAAGKLRALATLSGERLAGMPQVPTVAELGFEGYAAPTWNGLFVPARTPEAAIGALSRAFQQTLRRDDVRQRMLDMGITPNGGTPADFAAFLAREESRWRTMITGSGLLDG